MSEIRYASDDEARDRRTATGSGLGAIRPATGSGLGAIRPATGSGLGAIRPATGSGLGAIRPATGSAWMILALAVLLAAWPACSRDVPGTADHRDASTDPDSNTLPDASLDFGDMGDRQNSDLPEAIEPDSDSGSDDPDAGDGQSPDPGPDTPAADLTDLAPDRPRDPLAIGHEDSFEVMTWNLHNFPSTATSVASVADLIGRLEIDLIALQEVADIDAFDEVLDLLPGWQGVLSGDQYSADEYQKTGLIYRSDQVEVADPVSILDGDSYAFPRPPLQASVTWTADDGRELSFIVIVVHLKAGTSSSDESRRRAACEDLDEHIDTFVAGGDEDQFIVLGDYNDEIDDPVSDNVFTVFLDDPAHYRFLTEPLASDGQFSYVPYQRLLDHVLVTTTLEDAYEGGFADILELDEQIDDYDYQDVISDHRPVAAVFPAE